MSCHLSSHGPVRPASQGAKQEAVGMYRKMVASEECKNPLAWSAQGFSLDQFDMCFLPGGHEKSVRQLIDSDTVHKLFASYFPQTKKPGKKVVGALCHGVMVLSESKGDDGKSVIYDCTTTSLPARFEQVAFWGTRAFLGDYYKTYGQGSEDVEMSVSLDPPSSPGPSERARDNKHVRGYVGEEEPQERQGAVQKQPGNATVSTNTLLLQRGPHAWLLAASHTTSHSGCRFD